MIRNPRGIAAIMSAAISFVADHNQQVQLGANLPTMNQSMAIGQLKKALNGGKRGKSVKAQARKAYKRRAVKRARRLGHA